MADKNVSPSTKKVEGIEKNLEVFSDAKEKNSKSTRPKSIQFLDENGKIDFVVEYD